MNPRITDSAFSRTLSLVLTTGLGIVLILSGATKALNTRDFIFALASFYKLPEVLAAFGLLVPAVELTVGLALLLRLQLRRTVITIGVLILTATSVLVFGAQFGELESCRCFGGFFESSPAVALLRNFLLLIAAIGIWVLEKGRLPEVVSRLKLVLVGFALLVTGVVSGFSFHHPLLDRSDTRPGSIFPVDKLPERVSLHKGRQYLFVFRPTCSHCLDGVANVNLLSLESGSDVIGITADTENVEAFVSQHGADFAIYSLPEREFRRLFSVLPSLFYLEDGVVKAKYERAIPSPKRLDFSRSNR